MLAAAMSVDGLSTNRNSTAVAASLRSAASPSITATFASSEPFGASSTAMRDPRPASLKAPLAVCRAVGAGDGDGRAARPS